MIIDITNHYAQKDASILKIMSTNTARCVDSILDADVVFFDTDQICTHITGKKLNYSQYEDYNIFRTLRKQYPDKLFVCFREFANIACSYYGGDILFPSKQKHYKNVHDIYDEENKIIIPKALSSHTRMMFPYFLNSSQYKIILFAKEQCELHWANGDELICDVNYDKSSNYEGSIVKDVNPTCYLNLKEPEAILFNKNTLCIQDSPYVNKEYTSYLDYLESLIYDINEKYISSVFGRF